MSYIDTKVENYLEQLMPINDQFLQELQKEGLANDVPIIQVPSLKLIEVLINLVKPTTIIEVGSAIGFSTIWLGKAFPKATIHTIERKKEMAEKTRNNIQKAALEDQIILHEGDALNILPTLPKAEVIFIDAAKGKYVEFFEIAYPLLRDGGILIFDNILFRGYIADEEIVKTKPMLRKIRRFNDFIANNTKIKTSFIPIGDGLAICYKTEEE